MKFRFFLPTVKNDVTELVLMRRLVMLREKANFWTREAERLRQLCYAADRGRQNA